MNGELSDAEPQYVSIHIGPSEKVLIAGEHGILDLEVRLNDTAVLPEGPLTWT